MLKQTLDDQAEATGQRLSWLGLGGLGGGVALYWWLSYEKFSWDIMEPVTYFSACVVAIAALLRAAVLASHTPLYDVGILFNQCCRRDLGLPVLARGRRRLRVREHARHRRRAEEAQAVSVQRPALRGHSRPSQHRRVSFARSAPACCCSYEQKGVDVARYEHFKKRVEQCREVSLARCCPPSP